MRIARIETCASRAIPVELLALALVGLLLLLFLPTHYLLWQRFPVWYHLVFLGSLIVIPLLGARSCTWVAQ
jgi:hypothetical protein